MCIQSNFAVFVFYFFQALKSSEASEPKKNSLKKNSCGKASKKLSSEQSLDSSDKETDEDEDVKPKKKNGPGRKMSNAERSTKRKRPEKETKGPGKKRIKPVETVAEDNGDAEDSGNASEDSQSQSSAEKPVKVSTPSSP